MIPSTLFSSAWRPHVRIAALEISEVHIAELTPAERVAVAGAVPERRAEFATGRQCARLAGAELGLRLAELLPGDHRQPLWPEGVVGSISHCGRIAVAVVSRARNIPAIGIDIEDNAPLPEGTGSWVLTEREGKDVRFCASGVHRDRLVFSAKEAVYKCIFPWVQRFVDMLEVELAFDSGDRFLARPAAYTALHSIPWDRLSGRFAVKDDRIWTAAYLRPE